MKSLIFIVGILNLIAVSQYSFGSHNDQVYVDHVPSYDLTYDAREVEVKATTPSNTTDIFYENLFSSIPSLIHFYSNMVAYIQYSMVASEKLDADKVFNPADPAFARCIQDSIDNEFYKQALNNAYDNYIKTVPQSDFEHDKLFINHHVITFNNELYKNVFYLLSQNESLEQNYLLSERLREQILDFDSEQIGFEGLSSTYYENFGDNSLLAGVIGEEIIKCQ